MTTGDLGQLPGKRDLLGADCTATRDLRRTRDAFFSARSLASESPPSGLHGKEGEPELLTHVDLRAAAAERRGELVLHTDQSRAELSVGEPDLLGVRVRDPDHRDLATSGGSRRGCRRPRRRATFGSGRWCCHRAICSTPSRRRLASTASRRCSGLLSSSQRPPSTRMWPPLVASNTRFACPELVEKPGDQALVVAPWPRHRAPRRARRRPAVSKKVTPPGVERCPPRSLPAGRAAGCRSGRRSSGRGRSRRPPCVRRCRCRGDEFLMPGSFPVRRDGNRGSRPDPASRNIRSLGRRRDDLGQPAL